MHPTAEREAGGHEAVGQLCDCFGRALHEHLAPDLLLREAHGGRVIVEGAAVEEVDHEHVVTVLAQALGGVEDALADTEDGMKERDRRHGTTQPPATETVEVLEIDALPQERGDRFVAHTGFDPRALATPYRWFRISPRRIQAWREVNELPGRELMRDGRWLV